MQRIESGALVCLLFLATSAFAFDVRIPNRSTAKATIPVDESGAPLFTSANPAQVEVTNFPPASSDPQQVEVTALPPVQLIQPTHFEYRSIIGVDPCTLATVITPEGWRLVHLESFARCCNGLSADCATPSCANMCFDGLFERPVP